MHINRKMFFGGNTAEGYFSFHNYIIGEERNKFYILKGMPGGGKSSLMAKIAENIIDEGLEVELHHCPSDPNSLDSIYIPDIDIAVCDGTPPHALEPTYPGITDFAIDLARFIDTGKISKYREDIIKAKNNNKLAYGNAYAYFKAAKVIRSGIEINIEKKLNNMAINKEVSSIIEELFFSNSMEDFFTKAKQRHMFSTANTPLGYIDYTDSILANLSKVYYINTKLVNISSKMLETILHYGLVKGCDLEIYHNSLSSDKIETLIINNMGIGITSNPVAKKFKPTIIDFNNNDSMLEDNIDNDIFNILYESGIESLKKAKKNHDILEECYKQSIDYNGVNEVRERLLEAIFQEIK